MEVYIKLRDVEETIWKQIIEDLWKVPNLVSVEEVDLIAFETRNLEFNEIISLMSEIVFVIDCNGIIKYTNVDGSFKHLDGINSELPGTNFFDTVKDEHVKSLILKKEDRFMSELVFENEIYLLKAYSMRFDDSNLSGYVLLLDDLTALSEFADKKRYQSSITFKDLVFESQIMKNVVDRAMTYSQTNSNILITGESGTGKELFTRAIHNLSKRRDKPFIAINCSSLPEQLLESELFGYESGSFTGALKGGKIGIFESCDGGTIFLDEIGDMPYHLQPRLLRVLQEKKIRRIGSNVEIPVDFTIISATNQNLYDKVESGGFRMDLYYRINTLSLTIPPLRERREDIIKLANHFKNLHFKRNNKRSISFSEGALKKMYDYDWPGNVRELQNVVERAVTLCFGKMIGESDIILNESNVNTVPDIVSNLDETLENIEKELILKELNKPISMRQAARNLGITHTRLLNRMKKYKLKT